MGSCAAPSAKGDDKFITTDYLQQCPFSCCCWNSRRSSVSYWRYISTYPIVVAIFTAIFY
ncbi:hypothetical protein C2U53_00360 (plasmid) [Citrobacter sp. CFNIH10]|nr:hypothetical protein C2U53_00360 [Citrobacter sp. CFNIH10]